MDLSNLSPDERDQLDRLVAKANGENPGRGYLPPQPAERAFGEAPKPNPPTITRVIDPADWVDKQIATLQAVGEANYRAGITRPKKDPIKAGIAAQGKYEAQMRKPEVLARRKTGLERTNMDEWAAMCEELGATNLVRGVTARRYKVERFVAAYQPKLKAHLAKIDAMPDVTDADRERRMIENLKGLKALKGKW